MILRDDLLFEVRNSVNPDEVHSAPPETAAGHASAIDPFEVPSELDHGIELLTAHRVIAVQAVMREIHQFPEAY